MKKVKENVEKEDATNRDLEIYVMKTIAKKVKGIQLGSLLFLTGINTGCIRHDIDESRPYYTIT